MLKLSHVLPFLLLTSCAVRQSGPRTWRFADRTLMPPGVAAPDLAARTFTAPLAITGDCLVSDALSVQRRHSRILVTVHREALLRQPPGWLADWIDRAVSQGCIPAGQGPLLTARILESLPLPDGAALRLLRAEGRYNFVELLPGTRLQVVSPVLSSGTTLDAAPESPMKVSGKDTSITVEMQAPANLIGVETAWYDLIAKPGGRGSTIVPTSARVTIGGQAEDRTGPAVNLFRFPPEAAFYRLFYKADESEVLALAPTRAALPADPDTCGQPACFPIPRGVGVNPYMRIEVNGAPLTVPVNATVRSVLQAARQRPEEVLPTLAITKPFAGRPTALEFDRGKQDILNLTLTGDEQLRWGSR
uniref:Lipoprotein n=1 Tax=Solibacter usitatus (strain Ellin6076) TaxID=234267 RepID=Q01UQ1_SOLUE